MCQKEVQNKDKTKEQCSVSVIFDLKPHTGQYSVVVINGGAHGQKRSALAAWLDLSYQIH
jgi:hypothetical protein